MLLQQLCVYCGSSPGRRPDYLAAAEALAAALLRRRLGLVYGGASLGLMGRLADAVLAGGGRVVGVIPEALVGQEIAHPGLSELHITASMHARKARMAELADGFIALPGGLGTLEELVEIWTWGQLSLHRKPCALLNVAGYYDALIAFLDHASAEGFIRPPHRQMLIIDDDPDRLLARMADYAPPPPTRWSERSGDAPLEG